MSNEDRRALSQITEAEWVEWEWHDATNNSDEVHVYSRGRDRTPEERAAVVRDLEYLSERGVSSGLAR